MGMLSLLLFRVKGILMSKVFIGIDNGVTGSIGIITDESSEFFMVPTFSQQSYTKAKANITRIDHEALFNKLSQYKDSQILCHVRTPDGKPNSIQSDCICYKSIGGSFNCVRTRFMLAHIY